LCISKDFARLQHSLKGSNKCLYCGTCVKLALKIGRGGFMQEKYFKEVCVRYMKQKNFPILNSSGYMVHFLVLEYLVGICLAKSLFYKNGGGNAIIVISSKLCGTKQDKSLRWSGQQLNWVNRKALLRFLFEKNFYIVLKIRIKRKTLKMVFWML
jgi:hypothetical protein